STSPPRASPSRGIPVPPGRIACGCGMEIESLGRRAAPSRPAPVTEGRHHSRRGGGISPELSLGCTDKTSRYAKEGGRAGEASGRGGGESRGFEQTGPPLAALQSAKPQAAGSWNQGQRIRV